VFDNKVLRRMSGPKQDEVTGEWRKLHSEELSRLGGGVVSVLGNEPKGRRFIHGLGDGFLRTIKIRSTPSFGWEVKPKVPCLKILGHVKDPLIYQRN
jgi:hypothetical protein